MTTTRTLLDRAGLTPDAVDELIADIEVPVLSGPQRQGDVGIFPRGPITDGTTPAGQVVGPDGVAVIEAEAGGNTHRLIADGPVLFTRKNTGVLIGIIDVPEGSVAHLIHEEEHAAISIGPGSYRVHGKREQADEIRRVAD